MPTKYLIGNKDFAEFDGRINYNVHMMAPTRVDTALTLVAPIKSRAW